MRWVVSAVRQRRVKPGSSGHLLFKQLVRDPIQGFFHRSGGCADEFAVDTHTIGVETERQTVLLRVAVRVERSILIQQVHDRLQLAVEPLETISRFREFDELVLDFDELIQDAWVGRIDYRFCMRKRDPALAECGLDGVEMVVKFAGNVYPAFGCHMGLAGYVGQPPSGGVTVSI